MRGAKGVVFDVDGTLIQEISWQKLNLELGISQEQDQMLFWDYQAGKFSYQEWIDQLVTAYGKVRREKIEHILSKYSLDPQARAVCKLLQAEPYHVGIISAGLEFVVHNVAADIGVPPDYAFGNSTIQYDDEGFLRKIWARGNDHEIKLKDLYRMCDMWKILPEQCICVGDGHADKPLFEATGNGITFDYDRCRMLHDCCRYQISEISDLLKLL